MKRLTNPHHRRSKHAQRLFALSLCLGLLLPFTFKQPISAAAPDTEEVVYGKLAEDGSVQEVYVVNAFNLTEKGLITDQGNYSEVLNLSNTNSIDNKNGTIAVSADKGRFYYQGHMRTKDLPWLITFKYKLNGLTTNAAALSGQSGKMELEIKIDRNQKVDPVFFENYVLQISLTVNADKASNLVAEEATIANAGADKVVNWMVLPGQTAAYSLTADIQNFAMNGIQISAVPLHFEFQMPDLSQYTNQFADLHTGVADLNSGAQQLKSGALELVDGAGQSADGAKTLADNGPQLVSGIQELGSGVSQCASGVSSYVDGVGQLGSGSEQLLSGFRSFASGLDTLSEQNAELTAGSSQIASALAEMSKQLSASSSSSDPQAPTQLSTLAEGSQKFYEALKQIDGGLSAISTPLNETAAGLSALAEGLNTSAQGLPQIVAGLEQSNGSFATLIDQMVVPPAVSGADLAAQLALADPSNADVQTLLGFIESSSGQSSAQIAGLKDGLNQLLGAYTTLAENLALASDAFPQIAENLTKISAGLNEISTNLTALSSGLSTLVKEYEALNTGIATLVTQVGNLPQLIEGINTLSTQYASFDSGLKAYTDGVAQLASNTGSIDSGLVGLGDGIKQLVKSGSSIKNGANSLSSGATEAADGVKQYSEGVRQLSDGLYTFRDGLRTYSDGVGELAAGTQKFNDSIKDIDKEFEDKMNQEIENMIGGDFTLKSFTDPKNSRIKSVQFVMMSPEIAVTKTVETAPVVEERKGFLEKFLDLFR